MKKWSIRMRVGRIVCAAVEWSWETRRARAGTRWEAEQQAIREVRAEGLRVGRVGSARDLGYVSVDAELRGRGVLGLFEVAS